MSSAWRVKAVYGTGYRTPYSHQLIGETLLTRDEVSTLNFQLEWTPVRETSFSLTTFHSRLSDNVQPDPHAGISEPSDQSFSGVELYFNKNFKNRANWFITMSKLFSTGEPYSLSAYHYTLRNPDGTSVDKYAFWEESYDPGPDLTFNSGLQIQMATWADLSLNASWSNSIPYSYAQNTITGEYENPVLLNGEIRIKGLIENFDFEAGCKNILNGKFEYPGFYGPIKGDPLKIYVSLSYWF